MTQIRPYRSLIERLRTAGLRPTRQRLALARLLFEQGGRHVTAEHLHTEALSNSLRVSLATIYNTLHQFTDAGLLREIIVDSGRSYFDTNTTGHHHFFTAETGELMDIPDEQVVISELPEAPEGKSIESVDLVIRIRQQA
jgi:Fur family iron response transcriptional regulator